MTSISAISANTYQSPLQRLQDELQSEVSAGTISSSDQTALSSALTDIDTSLQASRSSDQSNGTRPSPDDLKSKIDSLIAGEVSSGKLTRASSRRPLPTAPVVVVRAVPVAQAVCPRVRRRPTVCRQRMRPAHPRRAPVLRTRPTPPAQRTPPMTS